MPAMTAAATSSSLSTGTAGASDSVTVNNFSSGDATELGFASAAATDSVKLPRRCRSTSTARQSLSRPVRYTGAQIATAITNQVGSSASVSASYANNALTVTSTGTAGASDSVTIDSFSTGNASQLGFAAQASVTDSGAAATDLTFDINGETVTLAGGSTYTGAQVATAITNQVGSSASVSASYANNALTITSTGTAGASDSVTVDNFSSGGVGQLGYTAGASATDSGSAAVLADSISFTLTNNGGTASTITINDATVDTYNTNNSANLDSSALTAANIASIINAQAGATLASVTTGGALAFTSTTTGASSSIAVASFATAGTVGGSTGIANNSDTGSAESSTSGANPKRAELVETYNDLLGQIDALAKDSGFNGVNLLNGDDLSVLFNEDGSSSLDDRRRDQRCSRPRPRGPRRHRVRHQHRRSTPPSTTSRPRSIRCAASRPSSVRTCRSSRPARTSPRT